MRKVVIQYDDEVKFFENVTKVQVFCNGDIFQSYLVICQGKKKTKIDMLKINGFEVKEK